MATYSTTRATRAIANAADFRTWGSWISSKFDAIGWAKTADTGQIDWGTVAKPAGANTAAGYEIRKSNDGLTDIYLKIEFGIGDGGDWPALWITAGAGSDGAGALTGSVTTQTKLTHDGPAATCVDYVSGTTGRLMLATGIRVTLDAQPLVCVIQRTCDATGAETTDGFHVVLATNLTCYQQTVEFATGASARETKLTALIWRRASIGSLTSIPAFCVYGEKAAELEVLRDVLIVPTTYAGSGSTHSVSHLGSTRTYLAVYGGSTTAIANGTAPVALSLVARWE